MQEISPLVLEYLKTLLSNKIFKFGNDSIAKKFIIQYTYFEYSDNQIIINDNDIYSSEIIKIPKEWCDVNDEYVCQDDVIQVNEISNYYRNSTLGSNSSIDKFLENYSMTDINKWVMKTFLDVGDEFIDKINLMENHNNTKIVVYSCNPKFGILRIDKKLDMRKKSYQTTIFACDLFDDFKPCHYIGKCYTK